MRGFWRNVGLKLSGAALLGALVALAFAPAADAGKFKVLHSFCGPQDGCMPLGGLTMDPAGNYYGTTYEGGYAPGNGTVYELRRSDTGKLKSKVIYRFCKSNECSVSDHSPVGNLVVDTQGNLYGVTAPGIGKGLVFELSPPADGSRKWTKKVLYYFCSQQNCTDGSSPVAGLAYAGQSSGLPYDGNSPLYGATNIGGSHNGGTIFSITPSGTETVIYNFCSLGGADCTDGTLPMGGVLLDQQGNIFGTTLHGGGNNLGKNGGGAGVVFQLSQGPGNLWTETVLYRFCSAEGCTDGAFPAGTLMSDGAGSLFSTTEVGGGRCSLNGGSGCGVIFKLVPNGEQSQETVLYAFCAKRNCLDGAQPVAAPALDSSGNLFGTTQNGGGNNIDRFGMGGGVVYELSGSSYKTLHHFCSLANCADGEYPDSELVLGSSGNLLGTTSLGGEFSQDLSGGVVYSVRP